MSVRTNASFVFKRNVPVNNVGLDVAALPNANGLAKIHGRNAQKYVSLAVLVQPTGPFSSKPKVDASSWGIARYVSRSVIQNSSSVLNINHLASCPSVSPLLIWLAFKLLSENQVTAVVYPKYPVAHHMEPFG